MAQMNFRPSDVPADDFSVIPEGEYLAEVLKSEIVPNKANTGQILKLTWAIKSGPRAGAQVWQNLNIQNANPQAQQIALRELADICEAVGVADLRDSEQLHGRPVYIGLKIRPAQNGYKAQNEVRGVRPYSAAAPQPQAQPQPAPQQYHAQPQPQTYAPPPPPPAPIGGGARPWSS